MNTEPFGYFKAEPFGWTDCAETDEGAIALYERKKPLPYNKDDINGLDVNQRLAFKLGWKAAEEAHGIKELK